MIRTRITNPILASARTVGAICAALWMTLGSALAQPPPPYVTTQVTFTSSGGLKIGALLGRPEGKGPFPAYISNHLEAVGGDDHHPHPHPLVEERHPGVTVEVGEALEKALKDAGRPVQMKVYPSFDTDGHTLFSNAKGYPIYVPDAVRFLDAQLNR